jgi:hypothetical protein
MNYGDFLLMDTFIHLIKKREIQKDGKIMRIENLAV